MANLMTWLPSPRGAAWALAALRWALRRKARGRREAARATATRIAPFIGAFVLGALADHFVFDHGNARRRRRVARERAAAEVRRGSRRAGRRARYLEGVAEGYAHRAAQAVPGVGSHKEPLDDVSLAQKVASEAFRHAGVSKAHVSVNAEGGVVYLRGRLDNDDEIAALVDAARAVEGVDSVQSLLHTPATAGANDGSG